MNNNELNNNQTNTQQNVTPQVENPNIVNSEPVINSTQQPVVAQPVVEAQPVASEQQPQQEIVNENLKKVEVNYTPPSKGKTVLLILFFVFLIGFVIFLPEITEMVNKMKTETNNPSDIKITDGKLVCTHKTSTTNLDKEYRIVFGFSNNQLEKLDYTTSTRGDITLDEKKLDELNENCKKLKDEVKSLNGIKISCDYESGKVTEKQSFVYSELDEEKIDAAYAEAGGTMPQYRSGQDMDQIEKSMNAAGYSCLREAN